MTNTARASFRAPRRARLLAGGVVATAVVAVLAGGVGAPALAAPKATKQSRTTLTTAAPAPSTASAASTEAPPAPTAETAPATTVAPIEPDAPTPTVAPSTTSTPAASATVETTSAPATAALAPTTAATPTAGEQPVSSTLATGTMLIGTRAPAATDAASLAAMNAWQGKTNAVAQTYIRSDWGPTKFTQPLDAIWNAGAVPVVSYDLQVTNAQVVAGAIDPNLDAVSAALKTWLSGPDAAYGTADDRRAYFRPAWEMNGNWYRWSPCYAGGGTVAEYKAMWQYLYGKFATAQGVDNTRLAWIYSVNSGDWSAACTAEALYPGDAYVDWTGIDGYTFTSTKSPYGVFNAMIVRLRALAPTKPISINEWGADSTTSVGKAQWLTNYFLVAHGLGVQMSLSFNVDKERDWAVFGGVAGDETFSFGGTSYKAWSTYRVAVADPRVVGSDTGNPRLLTNAQFLGRAG